MQNIKTAQQIQMKILFSKHSSLLEISPHDTDLISKFAIE